MTVEFLLGHQDHPKVEDFLASRPAAVGAITLHTTYARHQTAAAEAARDAGADVLFDPRTERLEHPDPKDETRKVPGWTGVPHSVDALVQDASARSALVGTVLDAHPDVATIITPPSFFVGDMRTGRLNVTLAEEARIQSNRPVRAKLLASSRLSGDVLANLAGEYAAAGITEIDLRLSPLHGEADGIRKITHLFTTADVFRDHGMRVILGCSGNIGQVAYALGHAHGYSVGIGENEHVNQADKIARQKTARKLDEDGKAIKSGGSWEGIYLPGLALTVSRKQGQALLANTDIRTRIGCRIGICGTSISGPLQDYRTHYMHARASSVAALAAQPEAWRGTTELGRIERALELRTLVNEHHQIPGQAPLKTRTLSNLVDRIHEESIAA